MAKAPFCKAHSLCKASGKRCALHKIWPVQCSPTSKRLFNDNLLSALFRETTRPMGSAQEQLCFSPFGMAGLILQGTHFI